MGIRRSVAAAAVCAAAVAAALPFRAEGVVCSSLKEDMCKRTRICSWGKKNGCTDSDEELDEGMVSITGLPMEPKDEEPKDPDERPPKPLPEPLPVLPTDPAGEEAQSGVGVLPTDPAGEEAQSGGPGVSRPRPVEGKPAEEGEEGEEVDCTSYGDCRRCTEARCSWAAGSCIDDCMMIADVSCYEKPGYCPKDKDTCKKAGSEGCNGCARAGCTWQEGECRTECMFGPLGDFIAPCHDLRMKCPAEEVKDDGASVGKELTGKPEPGKPEPSVDDDLREMAKDDPCMRCDEYGCMIMDCMAAFCDDPWCLKCGEGEEIVHPKGECCPSCAPIDGNKNKRPTFMGPDCSQGKNAKKCKMLEGCEYKNKMCVASMPTPTFDFDEENAVVGDPPNCAGAKKSKKKCLMMHGCEYKKKKCVPMSQPGGGMPDCSVEKSKKKCENVQGCEYKKKKCVASAVGPDCASAKKSKKNCLKMHGCEYNKKQCVPKLPGPALPGVTDEMPSVVTGRLSSDSVCAKPLLTGPCRALFFKWGFDATLSKCVEFTYGGCQGNENNFDSEKECMQACPSTV